MVSSGNRALKLMKQEVFDETWLTVLEYKKIITKNEVIDYNGVELK